MADPHQRFRVVGDHPHKGDVVTADVDDKGRYRGQSFKGGPFMHKCTFESCLHGSKDGGCFAENRFLMPIGDDE